MKRDRSRRLGANLDGLFDVRGLLHGIWAAAPRWCRRLFVWLREPHFIVSVAAAAVNENGEVLLCDHVLRKGASWGMPGGFMARGEDPEDAIRRELREELDVEIRDLAVALVRTFPATRQLEIIYRCVIDGEMLVDSVEIRDYGWFALSDLPPVTEDQRRLIDTVLGS